MAEEIANIRRSETPETGDAPDWTAFEAVVTAHFAASLALDREYDERFDASDLLGASSVLHLQAMQEAALGHSTPARLLAETAIYFADLCLSMQEGERVEAPRFVTTRSEKAARTNNDEHTAILEATEWDLEAAKERLSKTTYKTLEKARDNPVWLPYRFALLNTYCYALQTYTDIAQDRFRGTDPTIPQRNWALWHAIDMVDRLLVTRDKEEVEFHLPKEVKLQLATFAFDLIAAYEPPEAERGLVLEAQDVCYQGLLQTVRDETQEGKLQQGSEGHQLAQRISSAQGKIAREQQELGLRSCVRWGDILDNWRAIDKYGNEIKG